MADPIPVTLLTGFLGAGKTTLLNRLVKHPAMAGAAVLINEFGEIGLDHLLVETLDENTVLLNAGCLCCTVRGDLVDALGRLAPRAPTRVVIETTGLADPAPILKTLLSHPFIAHQYRLDGVVTVVDAANAATQLDHQPEAARQIAVADFLLVTKTDIADPAPLLPRLAALNPGAKIATTTHGEIDPAHFLGIGGFDATGKITDVAAWLAAEKFDAHHHGHAHDHDQAHGHDHHGHGHHHDPNRHDARIQAFSLTFEKPLHWNGIGTWLEMLVATRGDSLLRVKGLLNLAGQDRPVVIHGVQHVFHPPALLDAWPPNDPRTSRLVFITRDLPREAITAGLAAFEDAASG